MSKVNLDPGVGGNSFVMSHFRSLIEGHGTEPLAVNEAHYVAEGLRRDICFAAGQLHQDSKQGGAFHQRAHLRKIAFPNDQIALPIAGNQAFQHLGGPLINQRHIRDRRLAPPLFPSSGSARPMPAPHQRQQTGTQLVTGHGVQSGVDSRIR